MTKYLYRFCWSFRRGGEVEGLFVATPEEVAGAIGRYIDLGEALGKHSEVCGEIEPGDIKKLDVSPQAVEEVSAFLGRTWSGYNPLDYMTVECNECGNCYPEDDAESEGIVYREDYDEVLCDECFDEREDEDEE